jgi:large subunit ribosomal protein L21
MGSRVYLEQVMYAVIKTGGKQYKVSTGERLKVESLVGEVGSELVLGEVLAYGEGKSLKLGTPLVSGAQVKVKVLAHGRGDKVTIFKLRRRKHYQKHQGHRQGYTEIEVTGITA